MPTPTPTPTAPYLYNQPLPGTITTGTAFYNEQMQYAQFKLTSVTFYSPPTQVSSDVTVLFVVYDIALDTYAYQAAVTIPGNTTSDQTITAPLNYTSPPGNYSFGWDASGIPPPTLAEINYYATTDANWCGIVYGHYI